MTVRIVVPDDFPPVFGGTRAEQRLRAIGAVAVHTERGADREAKLASRVGDAEIVLSLRAYSRFSERVLTACPDLRLISIWGAGTDNVDLAACRARNVTVTNTPGVSAGAVAEHTVALMLAVARRIPFMHNAVRAGAWPRGRLVQLEGKTLGVIGLGAIGRRVAALGTSLGMRLLVFTWGPDAGRAAALGGRHAPIETLLAESDVVTLHVRLTRDSEGLLGATRMALMKPTAFLVNTARAGLVDRDALVTALGTGRLAGAALDVFHEEPIPVGDPLLALPNVVLTPHNAGMTEDVIEEGLARAVENVELFLKGTPRDVVLAPSF